MTSAAPRWTTVAWHAIRPHTLPLSLSPVLVGSVVGWAASGAIRLDVSVAAALSTVCMQVGANLQNDAADAMDGTDLPDREGPPRVTSQGWASARQVLFAARFFFGLAVVCGLFLVAIGGWPMAVLGLLAVLSAWAYSGGPYPIARGPFGELVVLVFFGFVAVTGVAWLYAQTVTLPMLIMGLVVGLPAAAVLTINNLRDLESDDHAGRRTLAIRLGSQGAVRAIVFLLLAVGPILVALALWSGSPWAGALLGLPALALIPRILNSLRPPISAQACNANLRRTTNFQMLLSLGMSAGIILSSSITGTI